jgi:toluene monooxygenase system protein B
MTMTDTAVEPQLVPVNAIFADDFVEILVAVTTADTIAEVAAKVAHHVEGKRVRARDAVKVVFHDNRALPLDQTVADAGIAPFDHIRVDYADPAPDA